MRGKRVFCVYILMIFFAVPCLAGMLIETQQGSEYKTLLMCEDGLFKIGTEEIYSLINLKENTFYMVNSREKTYMGGTLNEIEEALAPLKKQMEELKKMGLAPGVFQNNKMEKTISYKCTGEKKKILGYKVVKWLELEDGTPVAEIWVSEKAWEKISNACDYQGFCKFMERLKNIMSSIGGMNMMKAQQQDFYKEGLIGFPLMMKYYRDNSMIEVKTLVKKDFSVSYFQIPQDYRKISFGVFGAPMGGSFKGPFSGY